MKNGFTLIELITVVFIVGIIGFGAISLIGGCRQHMVRNFGGSMAVNLDPNVKLVNATWKNSELWILTTERTNEPPKIYNFSEKSVLGILQGNVKIVEK